MRLCVMAIAAAGLGVARPVNAQPPTPNQTAPRFEIDASIGGGDGNGGEFRDRGLVGARFALSVRGRHSHRVAPFVELARDYVSLANGHDAVCLLSPRGGCVKPYPDFRAVELLSGAVLRPTTRAELRLGIGGGAFHGFEEPQVGGALVQADAALLVTRHFGLTVGTRYIAIPRFRGDRLWTMPTHFGLRAMW